MNSTLISRTGLFLFFLSFSLAVNAQSWRTLGIGANALNEDRRIFALTVDPSGNVYAGGQATTGEAYVSKWNGAGWARLQPGYTFSGSVNNLTADAAGNIYAAGDFHVLGEYYVAKWNGTAWAQFRINTSNAFTAITVDGNGNLYGANQYLNGKYFVARWQDTAWQPLDTASSLISTYPIRALTTDAAGNVYAAGDLQDANGKSYIAKWNGTSWSQVGTGANGLNIQGASVLSMTWDRQGNLYAASSFLGALIPPYIARWNGTSWSQHGSRPTNSADIIYSIAFDAAGNFYASNFYKNGNERYVAMLNGTVWEETGSGAGALQCLSTMFVVVPDAAGNIYTAFSTSGTGNYNVAKYTYNPNGITSTLKGTALKLYPNPAENILLAETDKLLPGTKLSICTATGAVLKTQDISHLKTSIDISSLAPGLYFLQYMNGNEKAVLKFTKK